MGSGTVRTGMVKVVDDAGHPLVVDEYTEVLEEGTVSFPGAELVGLREYRLGDDPATCRRTAASWSFAPASACGDGRLRAAARHFAWPRGVRPKCDLRVKPTRRAA